MEAFKNLLNPALVQRCGQTLQRSGGRHFDLAAFERLALPGLESLEMKARAMQIANALQAALPARFEAAASIVEGALAPPQPVREGKDAGGVIAPPVHNGLNGWIVWPLGEFVARAGLAEPQRALACLHALTQRFTAEFAIRPFIVAHPDKVFATLQRWVHDDSAHVRRLVSEGSRPRLPWGLQLKALMANPEPTLPFLRALQDDPSAYVRRSVANHLNDIAKDHPKLVADWLHEHWPTATPERQALLRHAARGLIKAGHPRALAAFGVDGAFKGELSLACQPQRVQLGGEGLQLQVQLRSTARRGEQKLVIDYAVHHIKADGGSSPKVFKGWTLTVPAGQTRELSKRHAVKPITTRRYYAGRHRIELLVNGRALAEAAFDLSL